MRPTYRKIYRSNGIVEEESNPEGLFVRFEKETDNIINDSYDKKALNKYWGGSLDNAKRALDASRARGMQ